MVSLLNACGGPAGQGTIQTPTQGLIRPAFSDQELFERLIKGLTQVPANKVTPGRSGRALSDIGTNASFSTTYVQEPNIDEFDIVKYDGNYMYLAPTEKYFGCCFIRTDPTDSLVAPRIPDPNAPRAIRIMQTDIESGQAIEVGLIKLEDSISIQGLYLHNNQLITIGTENFHGTYGQRWGRPDLWYRKTTTVTIYDVSKPAVPSIVWEANFEGGFVHSRRVGQAIYLVTRHVPSIEGLQARVLTEEQASKNAALLAGTTLSDLLPTLTVNGESRLLVKSNNCFLPTNMSDVGYPVLTTITAIPLDSDNEPNSVCYNDDAYGAYVSPNAIYIGQLRHPLSATIESSGTRIHKFRLASSSISYAGSADVLGVLWTDDQSDFRANEHNGDLRILTSSYVDSREDIVDHHLFVLRENTTTRSLDVIGRLPNEAYPKEIGKPNELLYGVRFLGDRLYAVTFERIDPLYTIDLSNPENPKLTGTLEIQGFSELLHPVSEELLLGLGQTQDGAVKLELFNVSEPQSPYSLNKFVIGGRGTSSEANWDRHAFTYLQWEDGVDRFSIPADIYAEDNNYTWLESGLYFFEIRHKDTAHLANMAKVGSLVIEERSDIKRWPTGGKSRSVIHNDTVFFIRDQSLWSTFWNELGMTNGPF